MVDRYRSLGARMLQEPHGAYVTHEDYQRLEAERQRLINIAGDALGFSAYQRDQDTVEVLANHAKRLGEELAKWQEKTAELKLKYSDKCSEFATLRAQCERLEGALKSIAANTCCDKCQEAAIVAKQALEVPRG